MAIKFSLVIPCYNEAQNLTSIIQKSNTLLSQYPQSEIILVNNGSTDQSSFIFENNIKHPHLSWETLDKNLGYGGGILYGLSKARGDILAWTHADLQTDLQDAFVGFELFEKEEMMNSHFIIKGKRTQRPLIENILTKGMQYFASLCLLTPFEDINAQPKIFPREFYLNLLVNAPQDFSLDLFLLYMAHKNKYQVITFPVSFHPRIYGEAKGGAGNLKTRLKLIRRTVSYILKLKREI